ncbi:hypothetical protein FISHEDRAFT_77190 [Fistulina hepatica ATCC 64428]|uniref:Uncharacterized protein n=1 Tax=Fistulina hepatica ATCC 64428 TaxID=1128425 RepID=A0A0D7A4F4_9AGAR|nr:hypothetical protein FISHEDRAFT_77190 [Fistulina hepatica ATCC 64428]
MKSSLRRKDHRELNLSRSVARTLKENLGLSGTVPLRPEPLLPRKRCSSGVRREPLDAWQPSPNARLPPPRYQRRWLHNRPVHTLAVELLVYIFMFGTAQDVMFPVVISHVCSEWRRIALQTPTLWQRIALTNSHCMWRERIRRARSCGLNVELHSSVCFGGHTVRLRTDIHSVQWRMHLVTSYVRHWRSLSIHFARYQPLLWNAALSALCLPHESVAANELRELHLVYRDNDDSKEFMLFAGHAPQLCRATIDGIRLTWLSSLFGNLVYLDYRHHGFSCGPNAIHEVLSMLKIYSDRCSCICISTAFADRSDASSSTPLPSG